MPGSSVRHFRDEWKDALALAHGCELPLPVPCPSLPPPPRWRTSDGASFSPYPGTIHRASRHWPPGQRTQPVCTARPPDRQIRANGRERGAIIAHARRSMRRHSFASCSSCFCSAGPSGRCGGDGHRTTSAVGDGRRFFFFVFFERPMEAIGRDGGGCARAAAGLPGAMIATALLRAHFTSVLFPDGKMSS